jgi:hypothetical protein
MATGSVGWMYVWEVSGPNLGPTDFRRQEANLGGEWQPSNGLAVRAPLV